MKRKTAVIIAVLILLSVAFGTVYMNTRDFGRRTEGDDIEIFIPEGYADRYKELSLSPFQDWEIYEYRLDSEEIAEIEKELDNGFWAKIDGEDKEYFIRDFFYASHFDGRIWEKDFKLSDEVYVSSYTGYQSPFHHCETAIFDNSAVFVYDKGNSVYYGLKTYLGR